MMCIVLNAHTQFDVVRWVIDIILFDCLCIYFDYCGIICSLLIVCCHILSRWGECYIFDVCVFCIDTVRLSRLMCLDDTGKVGWKINGGTGRMFWSRVKLFLTERMPAWLS